MTNSARIPLTLRRRAFVGRRLWSRLARRLVLAAATLCLAAGVGTPAAFASAPTTFCVHYTGYTCPSGSSDEGADLQAALDAASLQPASSAAPNVVDIGPGSYVPVSGGFSYASSNPLQITGAGADTTSLTGAAGADTVLSLGNSDTAETVSISGVSITIQTDGGNGLILRGGVAGHITVTSPGTKTLGVGLDGATLSSSVIAGASFDTAVETAGQPGELDDDTVDAGAYGVVAYAQATIHRLTAQASGYGVTAVNASASIDDSLVKSAYALYSDNSSIRALNDTLVAAAGAQTGVASRALASGGSDVQILNSIVYGFPYSFETSAASGGVAEINARFDNYDGLSSGSDIFRTPDIGSDPGFVDALGGDYHLAFDSPLIDASSTTNLGSDSPSTDLDSNPRVVVDGNAATPVDLGAYEYQHRAPQAQATASPSSGNPGTAFSFDSAGSRDPDDGDHLSYGWSFDDGATATGATASHAFSTPGQHRAILTATDSSGRTSTATVAITVTPLSTGVSPVPGGSAGGRTGAPGSIAAGAGQQATAPTGATGVGAGAHGAPARMSGTVTIRISRQSIHGKSIKVTLSCGHAVRCAAINLTITTSLHHHPITVAGLRLSLRRRQTRTLTLQLNHSGRALLTSLRKLAITVTARLGGAPATSRTIAHATVKV